MPRDLDELVRIAAGPPPPAIDVDALRRGAERRRRGRRLAALAVVALAVVAALTVVPPRRAHVDLAQAPATADAPALTATQAQHQPTLLPPGYTRCDGPTVAGEIETTRFCGADGAELLLRSGPHESLEEDGRALPVGARIGYLVTENGWTVLTVSDRDSMDDRHYRLRARNLGPEVMAGVLASIPAIPD